MNPPHQSIGIHSFFQYLKLPKNSDWTVYPSRHLAYVMADAGYDVWMPNHRGNFYSRKNIYADPDEQDSGFWNFSFDDIGLKDYPPTFKYIQDLTGQPKLYVVSHSQATSSMLALLSSILFSVVVVVARLKLSLS